MRDVFKDPPSVVPSDVLVHGDTINQFLREGLSELELYGDLVYKFKKLGMNDVFLFCLEEQIFVTVV